jgi:hypothetical protein
MQTPKTKIPTEYLRELQQKRLPLIYSTLSVGLLLTAVTDTFGGGATAVDTWPPLLRPNVLLEVSKL